MCKEYLYIAIFVSAIIAIYELLYWSTGINFIIAVLAGISAFYGYVLLKCCCKTTKRKR
jgi:hypothetical protein